MKIILANPRGFCAGVERAIACVKRALERYGAPVYVLNDIVHNATVVQDLASRGAVFVKHIADVPEGAHLLFSAHGVAPRRWEEARARDLEIIDATCPLVEKVHLEAQRYADEGYTVVLIGEIGHDEVIGTVGQAPDSIKVVFSTEEVEALQVKEPDKVACVTQTTLSMEVATPIFDALRNRFPNIVEPSAGDICYATHHRQNAVITLSPKADLVLVVGDQESANSRRLAQIGRAQGKECHLISSADKIDPAWLEGVGTVLVTSGASVPESLVQGVVEYLKKIEPCEVDEVSVIRENVHFKLPPAIA